MELNAYFCTRKFRIGKTYGKYRVYNNKECITQSLTAYASDRC